MVEDGPPPVTPNVHVDVWVGEKRCYAVGMALLENAGLGVYVCMCMCIFMCLCVCVCVNVYVVCVRERVVSEGKFGSLRPSVCRRVVPRKSTLARVR